MRQLPNKRLKLTAPHKYGRVALVRRLRVVQAQSLALLLRSVRRRLSASRQAARLYMATKVRPVLLALFFGGLLLLLAAMVAELVLIARNL